MDDLLNDFLAETHEFLQELDTKLVELEKSPSDQTLIGGIFRIIHTIKGTCGFLGLSRLEKIAHATENVLDKIRDGKILATSHNITLILQSIDVIKGLVESIENDGKENENDMQPLIDKLNAAARGEVIEAVVASEVNKENEVENNPEIKIEDNVAQEKKQSNDVKVQDVVDKNDEHNVSENKVEVENAALTENKHENIEHKVEVVASEGSVNNKHDNAGHDHPAAKINQTIRVNVEVLEALMQVVSELVLTRNQLMQTARVNKDNQFTLPLQRLNHITSELQEKVMKTRMQPIGNAWSQFPRMIRDLSRELNKKVQLKMIGEETELDRQLIESIKDPLTHMVRNSLDHGLELPEDRKKVGKNETGTVTLKAFHQGGHIIIQVTDDGRGLSLDKIKKKIINNGLLSEADLESLDKHQIEQFIFKAGFSTAEKITSVSGRGVGMDVVKTNIEKISGSVEFSSNEGKGTVFTIKIPLTLAIMPILIIECNGGKFGIPQISIVEMVKAGPNSDHPIEIVNNRLLLRLRDNLLPLILLKDELFNMNNIENVMSNDHFIVVCEVGNFNFGIIVDKIYDTEEIVVKPVAPVLKSIELYSGSTLLGDGNVVMILDPSGLMKKIANNITKTENNLISKSKIKTKENNDTANFLVFKAGNEAYKAVPLDIISRLEEVDVGKIEHSVDKMVLQYRNHLMHIVKIDAEYAIPSEGVQQLIVFTEKDKILGIAVEEIVDIVESKTGEITETNAKDGYIGSIVINAKTMDLVDVNYYFSTIFANYETSIALASNDKEKSKDEILFIDDSAFFRRFVPPILEKLNYDVISTDSSEVAMNVLENSPKVKLIITDINMPGISGTEFALNLKKDSRFSNIPIIALSSNVSEALAQNLVGYGIESCVSKTNYDELVQVVKNIIERQEKVLENE